MTNEKNKKEELNLRIKKLLNLDYFNFRLIKGGINVIVGENNTGKTKLLDYIFYKNEEWDKLNKEYKSNGPKALPIFFKNFRDGFPVYGSDSRYSSKEEKGKLKCSYELYYFDLKSHFPFLIEGEKKIIDKGVEFKNIKERSCVLYYTEDNLERDTEMLKSAVMKEVGETKNPEPLILKYEDEERNFILDVDYGIRGYNPGMGITYPWLETGSGLLKYSNLKSLTNQILEKFKSKNTEIDKEAPFRYSEIEIYVPILLIEEPELLLHPSLTISTVNLVRELADNNITTIMSTHSPLFLSHLIHHDKLNLFIMKKSEEKKLLFLLNFWKLVEKDWFKDKVIEEYKEFARLNEKIEENQFYQSKWKKLLNEHTLKVFFSKNILFVEGTTEYILFNNVLREKLEGELNSVEIIPIFGKFHYVFFNELAKKLDLKYWFLLDKDRKMDDKGKESWANKQKKFWEKYGENETNEETNGIIHSKKNSENRISWLPFNTEEFLGVKLEHDEHQCCKEYNIISRSGDILENLERKQEKLEELKNMFVFLKTERKKTIMINQTILGNISKKLELRQPNQEAIQAFLNHYYDLKNNTEKLSEYILSVATGVGKTYIIAAILNYLSQEEKITNFLIVAPGKIIREKTINNFSVNKPNSLADKLTIKSPHIIDIKNFHTVKTEDKNSVKLFIFTVQSLTQTKGKTARKTSNYDEVLGKSLREHLSKLNDLVIFADEHHLYYGEKFSEAIRELNPKFLIGLTGTPHEKTPPQEIIFEYPLWKALQDKLIKTPVMVGRYDGYQNEETKLKDAIKLLEAKQNLLDNYTQLNNLKSKKALMLVIAPSIEEAEEIRNSLIVNCEFPPENILQVDSSKITDDLAKELQNIDNLQNPTRIIVAVGMLKEGWDVKNVYVIVPLRAFKSTTFIEQIIGRGLRLPFGQHTPKEALNTLEIIMHDNFQELLNVRKSLKNNFFRKNEEKVDIQGRNGYQPDNNGQPNYLGNSETPMNGFDLQTYDERQKDILEQAQKLIDPNKIKENFSLKILRQKVQPTNFSLKRIWTVGYGSKFSELGKKFSSTENVKNLLQRWKVEVDSNQQITWKSTQDDEFIIEATQQLPKEEVVKNKLIQSIVKNNSFAQLNYQEIEVAGLLVDKFLQEANWEVVSQYLENCQEQLKKLTQDIFKQLYVSKDETHQQIIERSFNYFHPRCEIIAENLEEEFVKKSKGYRFNKSLYTYDNFDSNIEFQFACLIDKTKEVKKWIRLLSWGDELYILWGTSQRYYYPDFLVIDENDIHWIVEIKDDNNLNPEIEEKNRAAKEWVNILNLELGEEERKSEKWRFLYITKGDMNKSHENWNMLKEICRI